MIDRIKALTDQVYAETVRDRRYLHTHPELSYQERATADYVAQRLREAGITVRTGVAGTGLIGVVQGRPGDRCVCLRADLDALPVLEQNDVPYRSMYPGVMHACGHDAHTAMVLAAGRVLQALRAEWSGTVLLLFQPGEERIPGGATLVLQEKALRDPVPASIIGQHVTPELQVGQVGFRGGPFMASSDELHVSVKGKGGHAAAPDKLIDPILITAHLITVLQQVVSRRARPATPTVLSFGKVIANGATNVIPDEVKLEGTLRTFDEAWRAEMHAMLPKMAQDLAASMGGSCEFEVRKGYPAVVNDEAVTARLRTNAEAFLGADSVVRMDQRMGSEDFAFYTQVMPGCFYRLGTGNPANPTGGLHTSTFNIDEEALRIGSGLMAWNAVRELS